MGHEEKAASAEAIAKKIERGIALTVRGNVNRVLGLMAGRKIQLGQVWKREGTTDTFLVTKIYAEALATFVLLRRIGAETETPIRLKVERTANGQNLPGYVFAQEHEEF